MDLFVIITSLFGLASLFSFLNARFMKLPGVIGVMILAILASLITIFASRTFPIVTHFISELTSSIDFSKTLLDVMLGFLLFASALHFDIHKLKENLRGIIIISTVGVIISTVLFASGLFYALILLGIELPFIYCLLFGALISPTDAIAVAALLKRSKMPPRLETIISGESLFNDGIGLVLFISFLEVASTPEKGFSIIEATKLFSQEVFGGLALGISMGWIAYLMMRSVKDFQTILLISITLVMSISVIAGILHVSIPLAVVAAGLLLSSKPFFKQGTPDYNKYLEKIWGLMDELLNTILFVMVGLQMVLMKFSMVFLWVGLGAILILLLARALSIVLPVIFVRRSLRLNYNSITILTWGGLRGGISIAMALSIPASSYRDLILTGCFCIVVFSIIVQGLTLNTLVNRLISDN
ncbi:sodium:proton antiporter [Pedobacter sp. MC2016-05]|uniref:cation:proton antiporter n=1 Tax=Pedobacter sp. MC2016-05 TaxID=2994474 RepID=UPI002246CEC2|nr:sodium:proton antiporter [Pedobacter sp. MC2016-05]MCX2475327.1 sodium:proton antiporter [Pedobacter sp. MC2016-05]